MPRYRSAPRSAPNPVVAWRDWPELRDVPIRKVPHAEPTGRIKAQWVLNTVKAFWPQIVARARVLAQERGFSQDAFVPKHFSRWTGTGQMYLFPEYGDPGVERQLGCGSFGCVFSTVEPSVTFKLSLDEGEMRVFRYFLAQRERSGGWPEALIPAYGVYRLPATAKHLDSCLQLHRQPICVLWRDEFDPSTTGMQWAMKQGIFSPLSIFEDYRMAARYRVNEALCMALAADPTRETYWDACSVLMEADEELWPELDALGKNASQNERDEFRRKVDDFSEAHDAPPGMITGWLGMRNAIKNLQDAGFEDVRRFGRTLAQFVEHGWIVSDLHAGNMARLLRAPHTPVITDPGLALAIHLESMGESEIPEI